LIKVKKGRKAKTEENYDPRRVTVQQKEGGRADYCHPWNVNHPDLTAWREAGETRGGKGDKGGEDVSGDWFALQKKTPFDCSQLHELNRSAKTKETI